MKILLTHGYFLQEDPVEQKIMMPYPPMGLLYVSGYLEENGIEHEVFDTTFSTMQKLFQKIREFEPDYLGVYVNFLTRINILKIMAFLGDPSNGLDTRLIVGGPDVRYHASEYLQRGADFMVVGEGEITLYELIRCLESGRDPGSVKGIVFQNDQGELYFTAERDHIKDLDELPLPNRSKIDILSYLKCWKQKHDFSSMTISTQRGCPFTCNWCSHAVFGDTYRRRSPDKVVDEIEKLVSEYAPDRFWFVDDVFTMSKKWLGEFSHHLKHRNLKINFECITRADRLDEQAIQMLADAGCNMIWIGAESGSQRVLDNMDRGVEAARVRQMIKLTSKYGIPAGTFIMLGYPGETLNDIQETIKHLKESNPDRFTINLAYPIKGTRMYESVSHLLDEDYNWDLVIDRDVDFKRTYRKGFYRFAVRKVYNEVFAYKSISERKIMKYCIHKLKSAAASFGMVLYK